MNKELERPTELFLAAIDTYDYALDVAKAGECSKDKAKEIARIKKVTKSFRDKLSKIKEA